MKMIKMLMVLVLLAGVVGCTRSEDSESDKVIVLKLPADWFNVISVIPDYAYDVIYLTYAKRDGEYITAFYTCTLRRDSVVKFNTNSGEQKIGTERMVLELPNDLFEMKSVFPDYMHNVVYLSYVNNDRDYVSKGYSVTLNKNHEIKWETFTEKKGELK